MRNILLNFIFLCCITLPIFGQEKVDGSEDYVVNKSDMQSKFKVITIDPKGINPLFGNVAKLENIRVTVANHMSLWVSPKDEKKKSSITWEINSPKAGTYNVSASVEPHGTTYVLKCNGKIIKTIEDSYTGFKILELGKVPLLKGKNTLIIEMENLSKNNVLATLQL